MAERGPLEQHRIARTVKETGRLVALNYPANFGDWNASRYRGRAE
jgi:hypothetical protein